MSRVQELFEVGKAIGDRLERIDQTFGANVNNSKSDAGFNPLLSHLEEYYTYTENISKQLIYICKNVDDYNKVWNGTMRDYYFALTKFLQEIPKETKKESILK